MPPNVRKMVMCNMENVVIPRPPALPPAAPPLPKLLRNSSTRSRSSNTSGFRLNNADAAQDDTGSVYSIYKQKIDSMFESDSSSTKNSVQAKIEKMFCDVAKDSGIPLNEIGLHSFSVDYLGSVPLQDKVTSLAGLQSPLRQLYFTYKKITKQRKTLTGRLEISSSGLRVQYQSEKGDLEQVNSFPTIAVWSAVKFVIHEGSEPSYAFLPLITDPDNIDKQSLFRNLDEMERQYITTESHSPLFAVLMRKSGVQKQLECHGFVCQTSEDAIVIAATLYKSVVAHMKAKEKKPKNRNGVTCMSIASSTFNDKGSQLLPVRPPRKKRSTTSSIISGSDCHNMSDTQPLLGKAPKKSTKTRRAPKAPEVKPDLDAIMPYEEPMNLTEPAEVLVEEIKPKTFSDKINTYMSREQKQITAEIKQVMSESTNKGLKRVQSVRKRNDDSMRKKENSGDILTKVTIPRSGSFLNAGGLTRYKSKVSRNNEQATGGSPLGFKEIFHELSLQEGLHSMDDILGVIIDPDGMSFNDLKPIYKEFLLKLSVTLTKDELYQRSKSIMRRQKKKLLRRSNSMKNRKHHVLVSRRFKRLKHIFRKNLHLKMRKPKLVEEAQPKVPEAKLPESSISTSSYDTRQFRPKESPKSKKSGKKPERRAERTSTSEESDFFSLRRKKHPNRNSSSGYVSCSECSYDSDTCTCVSADKCYCSLGHKNLNKKGGKMAAKPPSEPCFCSNDHHAIPTFCGCDTDSCAESNKCYCPSPPRPNSTILEQLKQRGFIQSAESIVSANRQRHPKVCKNNSNTKSTRSLEYMPNPSETYYERLKNKPRRNSELAVDYELFNLGRKEAAAAALYGAVLQKQASMRSYTSAKPRTGIAPGGEALSVKKSAEIAALFADIKLSQTTDIRSYDLESLVHSRNAYNKQLHLPTTKNKQQFSQRIVQNSIYASRNNLTQNPKMYNTENGLYTIQSQSDESRRSSVSGDVRLLRNNHRRNSDYFEHRNSHSLENSLGYLP